jgi:phage terminase large subunit GpA-like protein
MKWKTSAYIELPSQWAEQNRFLPSGVSNYPGKINHAIAPHMVEIQDCFHPDSGIKLVTVMKSTQSLATTTIENVIGWAIKNKLHNILYIISSKNIAKMRSSAAIDVLIDYSGLADYVKPISTRMKRKTADNTFYKEFAGGRRLMMTSYNSIADAKSFSWDFIIFDEIEEAPYELKGQGDPEKIFEMRGTTARHLKMAKISTPTNTQGRIHTNFLNGDQRYFFCRCPHCGELQILKIMAAGRDYGLFAQSETIDRVEQIIPDSIHYVCQFCKDKIYEYQKQDMLTGGKWIPQARPVNPEYRSYHISNLMSPIMFFTWQNVMQQFCETDWGQKITKFKNFVIDILGEPWESRSEKKDWLELKSRAENYPLQAIPQGALVITAGIDVQKNRLELQAVAWGPGMSAWTIDYQQFFGDTYNRQDPCWRNCENYLKTKRYKFRNIDLPITMTAIDSGYNPKAEEQEASIRAEHVVYDFVAHNHTRMIAVRGNPDLKDMVIKEERVKRVSPLKTRYDVAVNELKDEIFVKIDLPEGDGALHFPVSLPDEFFKGFLSEVFAEVEPGKWGWRKTYDRNEPLDTWIYARAAAERLNLPTWTERVWNDYEQRILSAVTGRDKV